MGTLKEGLEKRNQSKQNCCHACKSQFFENPTITVHGEVLCMICAGNKPIVTTEDEKLAILKVLKEAKKPLRTPRIAKETGLTKTLVYNRLVSLKNQKRVVRVKSNEGLNYYSIETPTGEQKTWDMNIWAGARVEAKMGLEPRNLRFFNYQEPATTLTFKGTITELIQKIEGSLETLRMIDEEGGKSHE